MRQRPSAPPPRCTILADPGHFLALGAGSGLAPLAPGTCGSLVGLMCYLPLMELAWPLYIVVVAMLFLLGVPLCSRTGAALAVEDHPAIVFDEMVGLLATLACSSGNGASIACGFALFRTFDVLKPWPIGFIERRLCGGLGVMADDLLAAVYAGTLLIIFEYLSLV